MQLRIYCICGQKMRVSSTMFGRPGKCIACRQKIRIPRLDEIPSDSTVVYLKDHPEFLRKPPIPLAFSEVDRFQPHTPAPEDGDEMAISSDDDDADTGPVIPLDPLEPLQVVCSLEASVNQALEAIKRGKASKVGYDKADLPRYRALVKNARNALDDRLRSVLIAASEKLDTVKEDLARASMSVRVGELDYGPYRELVTPLRAERDALERRVHNLRGWLATTDPMLAGGYKRLRLEEVPVTAPEIPEAPPMKATASTCDIHLEDLRRALQEREKAERRIAEWQRMERERALPANEIEEGRLKNEADRVRAAAEVAFLRERMEDVVEDAEGDLKALRSLLEVSRARMKQREISLDAFRALERDLGQAMEDQTKLRELARRALTSNSAADVPRPRSTFLRRFALPESPISTGFDVWLSWGPALFAVICMFVPLTRGQSASNLAVAPALLASLLVFTVVMAVLPLVSMRRIRCAALNLVWVLSTAGGALYLHSALNSISPLGSAMRADSAWYVAPGILMLAITSMLTGLAAAISVIKEPELRRVPPLAAAVLALALYAVFTDGLGVVAPQPVLLEPVYDATPQQDGNYRVLLSVRNDGWRPVWVGGDASKVPAPATLILERNIGTDSWMDMTATADASGVQKYPSFEIAGGEARTLEYALGAGTYRVRLVQGRPAETISRKFTLAEVPITEAPVAAGAGMAPSVPATAAPVAPAVVESAPIGGDDATGAVPPGATVTLQGVINADGKNPRFVLQLKVPGTFPTRPYLTLGSPIIGDWKAAEYNPALNSLTITDGNRLLVLDRDVEVSLGMPIADIPQARPTPVEAEPAMEDEFLEPLPEEGADMTAEY